MKWTKDKSLALSRLCVRLFMLVLAALCFGAPWLLRQLLLWRAPGLLGKMPLFLLSFYAAAVPAGLALWELGRMLENLRAGRVFVASNVAILRHISWECFAVAFVCLCSMPYDLLYAVGGLAAAFVGLILRVVKNVFAQAVALQAENDFTI